MAITFPLSSGWYEHFGGPTVTSPSLDFGSGSNRKCSVVVGYTNGTATPVSLVVGATDTLTLIGSVVTGSPGNFKFALFQGDLTVSGSQTAVATYSGTFGTGYAEINVLVIQGGGALTLANHVAILEQTSGSTGSSSRTVTNATGDVIVLQGTEVGGAATGSGSSGSALITNTAGVPFWSFSQTSTGTNTPASITGAWSSGYDFYNAAFTVTEAGAGTGPYAPTSDVTVSGWTSSAGGSLYATIDETSFDDADYIVSPTISVSTAPATFGISSLAAGNYTIGIRAKTSTGTATMRVYLLNGSNVSQGVTSDQTITSTFTTYSLPVTTTGTATRVRVEIVT